MDQSDERWGIWIGLKPGNKIANYSDPISKFLKLGYKTQAEIQSNTKNETHNGRFLKRVKEYIWL